MEKLTTHLDDERGAVVRWGPVLYVVWRAHDAEDVVSYANDAVRELTTRFGRERRLLYVHRAPALSSGHAQSEGTRKAVMEHFDRTEPYFIASAIAIEATGFAGAIVRSVASTMMLVRRSDVKSRVFADARPGVHWLATMAAPVADFDPEAMLAELSRRDLCRGSDIRHESARG